MFRLQRILSVKERQTTGRVGRHSLESTQELPGRRGLVDFATGFPEPLVSLHYEETQRERGFSSAMTALEKIKMTFILFPEPEGQQGNRRWKDRSLPCHQGKYEAEGTNWRPFK